MDSHKKLGKLCGLSTKSSDEQCDRLENEMKEMCPPRNMMKGNSPWPQAGQTTARPSTGMRQMEQERPGRL